MQQNLLLLLLVGLQELLRDESVSPESPGEVCGIEVQATFGGQAAQGDGLPMQRLSGQPQQEHQQQTQ